MPVRFKFFLSRIYQRVTQKIGKWRQYEQRMRGLHLRFFQFVIELWCEKDEKNEREAGIGPYFKKKKENDKKKDEKGWGGHFGRRFFSTLFLWFFFINFLLISKGTVIYALFSKKYFITSLKQFLIMWILEGPSSPKL